MTRYLLIAALSLTPLYGQTGGRTALAPRPPTRPKIVESAPAPAPEPAPPKPRKRVTPRASSDRGSSYAAKVKAAFAKRWAEAVQTHPGEFAAGNVSVKFKVDAEGKVAEFAVTDNTSNEAFAKFCEQFVRETELEKPSEKSLTDGKVEIPFTFWIY